MVTRDDVKKGTVWFHPKTKGYYVVKAVDVDEGDRMTAMVSYMPLGGDPDAYGHSRPLEEWLEWVLIKLPTGSKERRQRFERIA